MSSDRSGVGLLAIFLLIFIIVLGVTIWLLDLVAQQRIFGLLVSAELVAFGMLAGLYYEENPQNISRKWLAAGFAALVLLVLLAAALLAGLGSPPTPNVKATLYSGEVSASQYGFGNNAASITSPGPTLTFNVGDVVNMTVVNAGIMPHNWVITATNQTGVPVLFGAEAGTEEVPISPNQAVSTIFTVSQAGDFFYLCEIPGHLQLGMWGRVIVNP